MTEMRPDLPLQLLLAPSAGVSQFGRLDAFPFILPDFLATKSGCPDARTRVKSPKEEIEENTVFSAFEEG